MIEESLSEVYLKFKLNFYQKVFEQIQARETSLTTVETFCVEIIHALDSPTINEFANFIGVSSPNATYKVNSLIQKGYIRKTQSMEDKREYHIEVTDRYYEYYNLSQNYVKQVSERIEQEFSPEEVRTLNDMLNKVSHELMPEVKVPEK